MFIKLNRIESKLMKFVTRAMSRDNARPALNGVNINGSAVALDGFRLHAVRVTDVPNMAEEELPKGTITFNPSNLRVTGEGSVLDVEYVNAEFPDYLQVIRGANNQEIQAEIAFNPQYMIDALREMDHGTAQSVRLVIHSDTSPMELFGEVNERPAYAVIMPMHLGYDGSSTKTWTPLEDAHDD